MTNSKGSNVLRVKSSSINVFVLLQLDKRMEAHVAFSRCIIVVVVFFIILYRLFLTNKFLKLARF